MIYLFEPTQVLEEAIGSYFSHSVLGPGGFEDLLSDKPKAVVYDCTRKAFDKEISDLLLKGIRCKVLVVAKDDLGLVQSGNFKIYNCRDLFESNPSEFKDQLVHKVAWMFDPDDEFDHLLYLKDNPRLLTDYYNTRWARENKISDRQKAYHHFLLHGALSLGDSRIDDSPKNMFVAETNNNLKGIANSISSEIKKKARQNRLECICLNMTCNERDQYEVFVQRLVDNTDPEESREKDLVLVLNNDEFKPEVGQLRGFFKNVTVVYLNMSADEDIYVRPGDEDEYKKNNPVPKYGLKSGPNLMFFRTMGLLMRYDTSLLIETDCYFGNNWLGSLDRYVRASNGFLISGAIYDGVVYTKANTPNLNHLNGVALYATGDSNFHALIRGFECFLIEYVKMMPHLAYDYGMRLMLDFGLDCAEDRGAWNFINRNYVTNKYIFNFSTANDKGLDECEIYSMCNYAILHKKG